MLRRVKSAEGIHPDRVRQGMAALKRYKRADLEVCASVVVPAAAPRARVRVFPVPAGPAVPAVPAARARMVQVG